MAITVADNFSYQGKKPLDGRDTFATLAAMKAYAEASVYDGCLSYCDEDGKRYEFKSTNTVDPTTGKWREYSSGGGGETYSDFTGATSSTAGAHGLVPAPSAGDEDKVLFGNGAWGALPSVDLSMLSNEAFQFSTTEKAVGTWTDGKLLYSKVIELRTPTAVRTDYVGFEQSGIDIKFTDIWLFEYETGLLFTGMHSGQLNWTIRNNGTKIYTWTSENAYLNKVGRVAIFYTKTTDSPLPSDEKYAGVTSGGEVIYERTLSNLSINITYVSPFGGVSSEMNPLLTGIKPFSVRGLGTNGSYCCADLFLRILGNGKWLLYASNDFLIDTLIIRYTKTS